MNRQQLIEAIRSKNSFLCVGLDTDPDKLPRNLNRDAQGILYFNRAIIDAVSDRCVAFKINTAFYEALGVEGWKILEETVRAIPANVFTIADAKRGDIANTSYAYARAFFENFGFDAITVNPYMGHDSVQPFLSYKDKWTILLGLTSNPGSKDFQLARLENNQFVYERVLTTASAWGTPGQLMFVVGATHPEALKKIRAILPDHFLLIPGIGAQGGDLHSVIQHGITDDVGLLINVSRSIIYAGDDKDFARKAKEAAATIQGQMRQYLPVTRI